MSGAEGARWVVDSKMGWEEPIMYLPLLILPLLPLLLLLLLLLPLLRMLLIRARAHRVMVKAAEERG